MKQMLRMAAVLLGMGLAPLAHAQMDSGQYPSFLPWITSDQVIDDQRRYNPPQRLSPNNRQFLSPVQPRYGQPYNYDATTINQYLMGHPATNYRVRPLVTQPMYRGPGG